MEQDKPVTKMLIQEVDLLEIRMAVAKQEILRVFQELQEKVSEASRTTAKAVENPDSWRSALDALEVINDCYTLMDGMQIQSFWMLGDTAWEHGDDLIENIPNDVSFFS